MAGDGLNEAGAGGGSAAGKTQEVNINKSSEYIEAGLATRKGLDDMQNKMENPTFERTIVKAKFDDKLSVKNTVELGRGRLIVTYSKDFRRDTDHVVTSLKLKSDVETYKVAKLDLISNVLARLGAQRKQEILQDDNLKQELADMFSEILVLSDSPNMNQGQVKQKRDGFKEKLLGRKPTSDENRDLDMYLDSVFVSVKKIKVLERLTELSAKDQNFAQKLDQYNKDLDEIQKQLDNGKITAEEAIKRFNDVLAKAVAESGDEQLKKDWEIQKQEEEKQREKENQSYSYSDVAYSNREEAQSFAYDVMENAGFNVQVNGNEMKVSVNDDNDNFHCTVNLDENSGTGNYVYYVDDEYSNNGKKGPYEAKDFMKVIDQRHIDAYLSYELKKLVKDPDNADDVKDGELVMVGEKLIGRGEDRDFRFDVTDMNALKGLAILLATKDTKEPRLERRVPKLALYMNTLDDDNLRFLKKNLTGNEGDITVTDVCNGKRRK
ncbi:MAG: hypothetical protein WC269_00330 [Candidatus Gracilibacteria bacterium]|jgi:hypothetical protein